jgi:hypothetical protein
MSESLLRNWWVPVAAENHKPKPPKPRAEGFDPEFVAIVRIVLVTGALAVLLWALSHFG